jgi:hypothetical protein
MAMTAAEYAAKTTAVDQNTSLGIAHAIALAGRAWDELPKEQKTAENAKKIAGESVQKEDLFLEGAGTKRLVAAYTDQLVERSLAKDKEQGKAEGTNLMAYLDDTGAAVRGIDFAKVKTTVTKARDGELAAMISVKGDLDRFKAIKEKIGKSAKEHIGIDQTVENDFLKTVKQSVAAKNAAPAKGVAKGPKTSLADETADEPTKQSQSPDMLTVILTLVGAMLGIDLAGLFGLGKKEGEEPQPPTPEQLAAAKQKIEFAKIFEDKAISKDEFAKLVSMGGNVSAEQSGVLSALAAEKPAVILTPNASGENPGDTVIYARQGNDGKLTDIQVSITANGVTTTKTVTGDFSVSDQEVGSKIAESAKKDGVVVENKAQTIVADDISSGLSAAIQKLRSQDLAQR